LTFIASYYNEERNKSKVSPMFGFKGSWVQGFE